MNIKNNIQKEVEKTLQSIDQISRAAANPFLFTRIKAKMQRESNVWERIVSFVTKPAIAVVVLVVIFVTNGWFVLQAQHQRVTSDSSQVATAYDVSAEYSMFTTTNYELENNVNE